MNIRRKGFTLVELIIVTVLSMIIVAAAFQILISNRRMFTAQSATIAGQQSTRMAIDILFAELREVSASGGDILAMTDSTITVRLMRKFSVVCDTIWTNPQPQLVVLDSLGSASVMGGANVFTTDSVFIFAENDEGIDSDDVWLEAVITSTDSTADCSTGEEGIMLEFQGQTGIFNGDEVQIGAPVRSYLNYRIGAANVSWGDRYLAVEDTSGSWQPLVGPLRETTPLTFVYYDQYGAVTSDRTLVSQIAVTIRTGSSVLNSLGQLVSDSVTMVIHTRN
jgi:type II secretory pathway pseudopilin PulG